MFVHISNTSVVRSTTCLPCQDLVTTSNFSEIKEFNSNFLTFLIDKTLLQLFRDAEQQLINKNNAKNGLPISPPLLQTNQSRLN